MGVQMLTLRHGDQSGIATSKTRTLFKKAKIWVCGIAAAAAIGFGAPKKANADELTVYPAYSYNVQNDSHNFNLRITGKGTLPYGISATMGMNTSSLGQDSAELQFGHTEFRLHRLFGWLGPLVQYELEPGEDYLRVGMVFAPPLGENMGLLLRILPYSFATQEHSQAADFLNTKFALYFWAKPLDSLRLETYWHWSMKARAVWGEAAIDWMFNPNFGVGMQVRHNFSFDGPDSTNLLLRAILTI